METTASRDGGARDPMPILENLVEVVALALGDRRQAPVVDDQRGDRRDLGEHADIAAVGVCQAQLVEET